MNKEFWDNRYSERELAYGAAPNEFVKESLVSVAQRTFSLLDLGSGQGRNSIFAASLGYHVTAVDLSQIGLSTMMKSKTTSAGQLSIAPIAHDVTTYDLGEKKWDVVLMVFLHLPLAQRTELFRRVIRGLRFGGKVIMEAYAPRHLEMPGKGGPPVRDLLISEEELRTTFQSLNLEICREVSHLIDEGPYHQGQSVTTQLCARKSS